MFSGVSENLPGACWSALLLSLAVSLALRLSVIRQLAYPTRVCIDDCCCWQCQWETLHCTHCPGHMSLYCHCHRNEWCLRHFLLGRLPLTTTHPSQYHWISHLCAPRFPLDFLLCSCFADYLSYVASVRIFHGDKCRADSWAPVIFNRPLFWPHTFTNRFWKSFSEDSLLNIFKIYPVTS